VEEVAESVKVALSLRPALVNLRAVSRSFYLTLRILPGSIRPQIGLAYLLARTTDTIADTGLLPLEQRLEALQALRDRIQGKRREPLEFAELSRHQGDPAERRLLEQCEGSVAALGCFNAADQQLIRAVLDTITSGQELDLQRFANASAERIVALETDTELDDYTYRVAGCVGEFWTRMCRAHVFPKAVINDSELLANGIRFGKGLQLVNILRDLPRDLRQGRCYLPKETLASTNLQPAQLLEPTSEPRLRPAYHRWLDCAQSHLNAGWAYTNDLPGRCIRVRLACAWPLLIGRDTLVLLRTENVLDPNRRLKVSRARVRSLLVRSLLLYPFPSAWRRLFRFPATAI
jgi:farnesyl-diphosphate farnesyltransferase